VSAEAGGGPGALIRFLLTLRQDPIYRRERRHAFFGLRWLGPAARVAVVGTAYAAFVIACATSLDRAERVAALSWVGAGVAMAVAALTQYASPGLVGTAVAAEFDHLTAEALFLTPLSVERIVFTKLLARLSGLFETYVWLLPIFLLTPRPDLASALAGFDLEVAKPLLAALSPDLAEVRMPAPPISAGGMLLGLRDWIASLTAVYYGGAIGLASALFVRSGKLALVASYVGVLFVAGTIMAVPLLLIMAAGTGGFLWLAANGQPALGVAVDVGCSVLLLELLFSVTLPSVVLRFACRRVRAHLD
jgi:hypothetical protein